MENVIQTVKKNKKLKVARALFGMLTAAVSLYVAVENFRKLRKGPQLKLE
ncbi:hypothetical protein [Polluticoccus soli]|nr:hypothetical protein [Flavipsychrobacter sp. JY13-12]